MTFISFLGSAPLLPFRPIVEMTAHLVGVSLRLSPSVVLRQQPVGARLNWDTSGGYGQAKIESGLNGALEHPGLATIFSREYPL